MSVQVKPLQTVDAQTLKQGLEDRSVTLIDVRERGEFTGEHIPGATLVPLSQFDPRQIPQTDDTQLVLYCRTGHRSAIAAKKLVAAGVESVSHLSAGMGSWKKAGYPTVASPREPLSLMRQVQLVVGALVVTGTVLGALVSPWFLLLSGIAGTGLLLAGLTDICLLSLLLAQLPYNQRSQG